MRDIFLFKDSFKRQSVSQHLIFHKYAPAAVLGGEDSAESVIWITPGYTLPFPKSRSIQLSE
jgi:hypothetical protein